MQHIAFRMQLKPGHEAEYERRHADLWPELADVLHQAGIVEYRIWLDRPTLLLFAVMQVTPNNTVANLPQHPIVRRWWEYMQPLMHCHADHAPVVRDLVQVFELRAA